jgi:hypothetical protein
MARQETIFLSFNRGLVSRLGLARVDVKRLAMAAAEMVNWMPRVLGSMMLRPGLGYIGATRSNLAARFLPFVFSPDDKALLELTDQTLRVWINDALITRPTVTTTIANPNFAANIASWTASGGATWNAGGYLQFLANGTTYDTAYQQITVAGANISVEHALRIIVNRGPVVLRVGTTAGADDYIAQTTLDTGNHSLALTPTGDFFIQFQSRLDRVILVDSCNIEGAGVMTVPTPWLAADLGAVRSDQSADIVFCAATKTTASAGYQQYQIERRGARSWSVVPYRTEDGPFRNENVSPTTLTPSVLSGNGTLTASAALFKSTHVGALFYLTSEGQTVTEAIVAGNQFSDPILIEGVDTERPFTIVIAGITSSNHFVNPTAPVSQTSPSLAIGRYTLTVTGGGTVAVAGNTATITGAGTASAGTPVVFQVTVAGTVDYTVAGGPPTNVSAANGPTTVTLQRSLAEPGTWVDVFTRTADTTESYDDGLDNQVAYYRIGCKTSEYGADTFDATLSTTVGGGTGICRVTGFTNSTTVSIEVLKAFLGLGATEVWAEGAWSDYRGWPSAVAFYEGRLGWFGKDAAQLSVSDDYYSFDLNVEGDSGPILRTIGGKSVDTINWALPLQRLILGGGAAEHSCRSTSFDEPLTPTNFNIKKASGQGSAKVEAVAIDNDGIFVQRGGTRVFTLNLSAETYDYSSGQLSSLVPEIGQPGIVRMAVQRQPDTRVHFVRSDGTVAVLIFEKDENVTCWVEVETDGLIEDVVVLPGDEGDEEDHVYYVVKRTIGGAAVRYLERWATEAESIGDTTTLLADSYVTFTNGAPSATISGLTHLEGESVVVWADGKCLDDADGDIATFTVTGGQIIVTDGGAAYLATTGCVGLAYRARWQSAKIGQMAAIMGLKNNKNMQGLGLIMADAHTKGVKFGPDFDHLDDMPSIEAGYIVDPDLVNEDYDGDPFIFPGTWKVDTRLCLEANAPRPCTILAAICDVESKG